MTDGERELRKEADDSLAEALDGSLRLQTPLTSGIPPPPEITETGSELPLPPFDPDLEDDASPADDPSDSGDDGDDEDDAETEVPCHCEEFEEPFQVKAADGSGPMEKDECVRALRYDYKGSDEDTPFFTGREAWRLTQLGNIGGFSCDLPGDDQIEWFFDPSDAELQGFLALLDTPPTIGNSFFYTINFYFKCTRKKHFEEDPMRPGHGRWYRDNPDDESSSGVYLLAICYEGSYTVSL